MPLRINALLTFLFFTDCRVGAARKIRWSQIDLLRHDVRLDGDQVKNAEPITLPLPQEARGHAPSSRSDGRASLRCRFLPNRLGEHLC